jgi:hypothetical protein
VNCAIPDLLSDMEQSLESITKWTRGSGLVVNQNKIELSLFFKRDLATITINMGNDQIMSKKELNVLSDIFESKL